LKISEKNKSGGVYALDYSCCVAGFMVVRIDQLVYDGGFIHILLVVAVVIILVRLIRGKPIFKE